MSVNWQISAGTDRVTLANGLAEATFTVTNPGPVDAPAILQVECDPEASAGWFTVDEARRTVPHGGSVTYTVKVKVEGEAAAGQHWLAGRVYSADSAPEEGAVLSNRVVFEVAAVAPKKKIWPWILLAVALLVIVGGVVAGIVLMNKGTEVPDVVGMAQEEAVAELEDADFTVTVHTEPSEQEPGTVVAQDPDGGDEVDDPGEVTITVAVAPTVVVPTLDGFNVTDALLALQAAGLDVNINVESSSFVAKDVVIRTTPAGGSEIEPGGTVAVTVSSGSRLGPIDICDRIDCFSLEEGPLLQPLDPGDLLTELDDLVLVNP